jgi:TonB family protein
MWNAVLAVLVTASPAVTASVRHDTQPAPSQAVRPRPPIDWAQKPTGEDLARYYPERAARKELPGRATISCQVTDEGRLTGCTVVSESPPGEGFGEAALKASTSFRMRVDTGTSPQARRVRIPINFRLDGSSGQLTQKDLDGLRDALRPPVFGALGLPMAAMLIWWLAALITRRGRDDDERAESSVSIRNPHAPAWAKAARYGDIYPRTYRAEGFVGGGRGGLALLRLLVGGAGLAPAGLALAHANAGAPVNWAAWIVAAVMLLIVVQAVWRLAVLFRTFVVLEAGAIDFQGLVARRRMERQEIGGYLRLYGGLGPSVIRLESNAQPALRLPVLWPMDAVLEHWFEGLTDRDASGGGVD